MARSPKALNLVRAGDTMSRVALMQNLFGAKAVITKQKTRIIFKNVFLMKLFEKTEGLTFNPQSVNMTYDPFANMSFQPGDVNQLWNRGNSFNMGWA